MFGLGFQELVVVLVLALLFFGGNKLPEVGSALGKAIREFKHAAAESESDPLEPKAPERSGLQAPTSETNQDRDVRP
jgi:sec-independent protein translocase protein TatA